MKLAKPLRLYWWVMWVAVSPLLMATVIILKWVNSRPMEWETGPWEEDTYRYPAPVQVVGWVLELSPTLVTLLYPAWVVFRYRQAGFTGYNLARRILQPADSWEETSGAALTKQKAAHNMIARSGSGVEGADGYFAISHSLDTKMKDFDSWQSMLMAVLEDKCSLLERVFVPRHRHRRGEADGALASQSRASLETEILLASNN